MPLIILRQSSFLWFSSHNKLLVKVKRNYVLNRLKMAKMYKAASLTLVKR